jgi:hypothetical protein
MRKQSRTIVFALLFALAAAPGFAGIHYKSVTKTQGGGGENPADISVEGWVSGDNAKVEVQDSANPILREGTWLMTKNGAKTIYLVDPKEKTYAEWDPAAMLGAAGSVLNGVGPLVKFEFSDPKVEKLVDEAGPALLGQSTRHYKFRTSYTMKIKVFGMGNESATVTEEDIWVTDQLKDPALGVWLRSEGLKTGNQQLDKIINSERGKLTGFPLKTVSVNTSTNKKNNKQTKTTTTMEVTQLDTKATVPASAFEIPAGYEETEMMMLPVQPGRER